MPQYEIEAKLRDVEGAMPRTTTKEFENDEYAKAYITFLRHKFPKYIYSLIRLTNNRWQK